MARRGKPKIGTDLWYVSEHRYYITAQAAPVMEYCVCKAKVKNYIQGKYTEVYAVGEDPDGYMTTCYFKLADIGTKVFLTSKEAAEYAKALTEKYEQVWCRMGEQTLRRTWEDILETYND